jgi:hypothetical protein
MKPIAIDLFCEGKMLAYDECIFLDDAQVVWLNAQKK